MISQSAPLARVTPAASRGLKIGLAVSAALHLFAAASVGGRMPAPAPVHQPLQVALRTEVPDLKQAGALTQDAVVENIANPATGKPPEAAATATAVDTPPVPSAPVNIDVTPDRYLTADEVDVRAAPINEVDLVFPERAYGMRLSGTVVLRIYISEGGTVNGVTVVEASKPGFFEEAAVAAAAALKFSPALKNGREVKSQKTIEVAFDPYERINTP